MTIKQFLTKGAAPAIIAAIIVAAGAIPAVLSSFTVTNDVPANCTMGYGYEAGYGYGYGYDDSSCTSGSSGPSGGGSAYNPTPLPSANGNNTNNNNGGVPDNNDNDTDNNGVPDNNNNDMDNDDKWIMTSIDGQICKATDAGFDSESRMAYLYACVNNITTKRDIRNAIFYGPVIRKEFAKMISNYAVNVMGMTPDTTLQCDFNDVNFEDAEMRKYIKMACQLGLMGYKGNGIEKLMGFEPNAFVTRAQFGTVLSRMLYGDAYEAEANSKDWYSAHLQALKANGVLKMIDNPMMKELRGYVWIVFERLEN